MSETRLQDEYNDAVNDADIFVSLFATRAGRFTRGVGRRAGRVPTTGREPPIYTHFKRVQVRLGEEDRRDAIDVGVSGRLKELGTSLRRTPAHRATSSRHFSDQLRDSVKSGGRAMDAEGTDGTTASTSSGCSTADAYVAAGLPGERP